MEYAFNDFWVKACIASISFNPIFWNVAARAEYKYKVITKLVGGNKYYGCYLLAMIIFGLGVLRDWIYSQAIASQPASDILMSIPFLSQLGVTLIFCGNVLVLSSMWKLGITGTYLGDYFGILMSKRVTGFPFNVMNNPMYNGSTLIFVGYAFKNNSMIGLLLSLQVFLFYQVALLFEEPFTANIYKGKSTNLKKVANKKD